ncbi:helix-turn-helix domain-containing protein [Streptomyces sp. NPDC005728]|uniref:PucR family transcriptional regulator n=1 Tax=Streptomyces sp. NPDC005728 TaxID=3157054 RepID=UPI0033CAC318
MAVLIGGLLAPGGEERQERTEGARGARDKLMEAFLAPQVPEAWMIAELACAAGWCETEMVRAVVVRLDRHRPVTLAESEAVLASVSGGEIQMLALESCLNTPSKVRVVPERFSAAVGPVVPLAEAWISMIWARRLVRCLHGTYGGQNRVALVDDHLALLMLLQDGRLADRFMSRWLEPLNGLTLRQKQRVVETLLVMLDGIGTQAAARTLRVHPHTVRYRMKQIERLYGSALRDPGCRFELRLALHMGCLAVQMRGTDGA